MLFPISFDTHLSVGHAIVGIGHPVCAAHGSVDHGARDVALSSSLSSPGAHLLELVVVARDLLPEPVALLRRVILAALAPVKIPGIDCGTEDRHQDEHLARHCCSLSGSAWSGRNDEQSSLYTILYRISVDRD